MPGTDEKVLAEASLGAELMGALADLGPSLEAVATKLRAEGIKGKRLVAGKCPIARYLNQHGFEAASVSTATVSANRAGSVGVRASVLTPDPVATFVFRFDRGLREFIDLVELQGDNRV